MECVLGLSFKDFVLIACDATEVHSILVIKHNSQKIYTITDSVLMGVVGEKGDSHEFAEYVSKNMQLYKFRNGYDVDPKEVANFSRKTLADALRSRNPYYVNPMIAGYDKHTDQSILYFMDYLATLVPVPFGAHGYGAYFANATFDKYYKKDMSEDEAYNLLKKGIEEIQKRLLVNLPAFKVKVIDKNGARDLKDLFFNSSNIIPSLPA